MAMTLRQPCRSLQLFWMTKAPRLRARGVARSADEGASWQLLGLISLLDPPREDTQETIRQANDLGVEVSRLR